MDPFGEIPDQVRDDRSNFQKPILDKSDIGSFLKKARTETLAQAERIVGKGQRRVVKLFGSKSGPKENRHGRENTESDLRMA